MLALPSLSDTEPPWCRPRQRSSRKFSVHSATDTEGRRRAQAMTVKELKAELRRRNIPSQGLFERKDLEDRVADILKGESSSPTISSPLRKTSVGGKSKYLVVDISIGGHVLPFIIDTGSSASFLSLKAAALTGIDRLPGSVERGLDALSSGPQNCKFVEVRNARMGGHELPSFTIGCRDFYKPSDDLGVLGTNLLSSYDVEIVVSDRPRIQLLPMGTIRQGKIPMENMARQKFRLCRRGLLMLLPARMRGDSDSVALEAIFDLGSGEVVVNEVAARILEMKTNLLDLAARSPDGNMIRVPRGQTSNIEVLGLPLGKVEAAVIGEGSTTPLPGRCRLP